MVRSRRALIARTLAAGGIVAGVIAAGVAATAHENRRARTGGQQLFAQVRQTIAANDVDSIPADSLDVKAAAGLIGELGDPYASLFSSVGVARFLRNDIGNAYGGLGISIEMQPAGIAVTGVYHGSPAELGGVQPGDEIIQVNGHTVAGLQPDRVSQLLVGEPGSSIDVTLSRPGVNAPIRTRVRRAVVRPSAIPFSLVLGDHTGYIPLQRFNETAGREMASALVDLRRSGARSFVIDLRGNPGGDVSEALAVSNLFLRPGSEIAQLRQRGQRPQTYRARTSPLAPNEPVVVLVDHFTASASEIVAGALQDHDRAVILGEPTYGKGVVQSLFDLAGGYALKVTTGRWYTPSGRSIQRARLFDGAPDTAADPLGDSLAPRPRPAYRSDAGRTVFGGGGIAPDVVVASDTLTTPERRLARAFAPRASETRTALFDIARDLRPHVRADFVVQPSWRDAFFHKLRDGGVAVDRATFDAAEPWVNQLLEQQVATLAFGDSSAFRRAAPSDIPLQRALGLLHRATTQAQLWAVADRGRG